ncbi:HNH endonuclease [Pseudomonas baetica]|uniref:HNH endonuclease n=1 Tax=Pseudomonas baetica TaxID=674054 RepID=UPI003EED6C0D
MRKVDRSTVSRPDILESLDGGIRELDEVRAHWAQQKPGSFAFSLYKHDEVKQKLHQLFHGKCAYCETFYSANGPVDVEHYRPKGAVAEDPKHPGYWWLAMKWENLLPSCIDCNRKRRQKRVGDSTTLEQLWESTTNETLLTVTSGKKDSFPVAGTYLAPENCDFTAEQPLLLNPCDDDPSQFLRFNVEQQLFPALVVPKDTPDGLRRGECSIRTYGLNRLGLVQDRTRILRQLEFMADTIIELTAIADELQDMLNTADFNWPERLKVLPSRICELRDRTVDEIGVMAQPNAPYSTMVSEWLLAFEKRLSAN